MKKVSKKRRALEVLAFVLVVSLLSSVMTSLFTPSKIINTPDKSKDVIYVPVSDFGGRNVGSYSGDITFGIDSDNKGVYIAPSETVNYSDIDYFTVDFSLKDIHFATAYGGIDFYFGLNMNELTSSSKYNLRFYTGEGSQQNENGLYPLESSYTFFSQKKVVTGGENVTLIYRVNHDDYSALDCMVYIDGIYFTTGTLSFSSALTSVDKFYLSYSSGEVPYEPGFTYLEMNVFDVGYNGELLEYINDTTLNLSECSDAYLNYKDKQ